MKSRQHNEFYKFQQKNNKQFSSTKMQIKFFLCKKEDQNERTTRTDPGEAHPNPNNVPFPVD